MPVKIDLTGKKFGKLTVLHQASHDKWGKIQYKCECDCGNIKTILARSLNNGRSKSCGCGRVESVKKSNRKHNLRGTRVYRAWRTMRDKVSKGIYCEPTWDDVTEFYKDMGDLPSSTCTLQRKNMNIGFTKENTIWKESYQKVDYSPLFGKKFNKLTPISLQGKNKQDIPQLKCECECGNVTYFTKHQLVSGEAKSCGCLNPKVSTAETEIADFVESLGFKVIRNSRDLFANSNKEGDIFIPEKNLIIEYDGCIWHSTRYNTPYNIKEKSDLARANGYECIHIFSDQYESNPNLIKELIKVRLGLYTTKIGARLTTKQDISELDYRMLCEQNHLQGYRLATHKKGLFYKGELVACIGYNDDGELIRYTVKHGFLIQGALAKLTKHENITFSFCDLTFFTGNSYKKMGFKLEYITKPNFRYVKGNYTVSRNSMMKHRLKNKLNRYDELLTEEENCNNDGWYRLYDCGNAKYVLK